MYSYMEYILKEFYNSTDWNEDNIYSNLTATSENLIDFELPKGFNVTLSSQASNHSFSSYTLSNLGVVNGSISYLYCSKALDDVKASNEVSLQEVISGYKVFKPLQRPLDPIYSQQWYRGKRIDTKDTLLYGRVFLPGSSLEAMFVRRISPITQVLVTCVSDNRLKNGGALTLNYQRNHGRWCDEFIYSTHEALLGLRGLYNFDFEKKLKEPLSPSRISLGAELYYGIANKSPGMSTALRYTTQSAYTGTPLTMTVMCNPMMGHISTSYSLRTTDLSSFSTRFDFNVYSYASDLSIGCELWRSAPSRSLQVPPQNPKDSQQSSNSNYNAFKISASMSTQTAKLSWEGRFQDFLLSTGLGLSVADVPSVTSIGISLQFSS